MSGAPSSAPTTRRMTVTTSAGRPAARLLPPDPGPSNYGWNITLAIAAATRRPRRSPRRSTRRAGGGRCRARMSSWPPTHASPRSSRTCCDGITGLRSRGTARRGQTLASEFALPVDQLRRRAVLRQRAVDGHRHGRPGRDLAAAGPAGGPTSSARAEGSAAKSGRRRAFAGVRSFSWLSSSCCPSAGIVTSLRSRSSSTTAHLLQGCLFAQPSRKHQSSQLPPLRQAQPVKSAPVSPAKRGCSRRSRSVAWLRWLARGPSRLAELAGEADARSRVHVLIGQAIARRRRVRHRAGDLLLAGTSDVAPADSRVGRRQTADAATPALRVPAVQRSCLGALASLAADEWSRRRQHALARACAGRRRGNGTGRGRSAREPGAVAGDAGRRPSHRRVHAAAGGDVAQPGRPLFGSLLDATSARVEPSRFRRSDRGRFWRACHGIRSRRRRRPRGGGAGGGGGDGDGGGGCGADGRRAPRKAADDDDAGERRARGAAAGEEAERRRRQSRTWRR